MSCKDCPYYWHDEGEQHGTCHYRWNDGYAPCEVEETEQYYNEEQ